MLPLARADVPKRLFDLVVGGAALVVLSPIIIGIAVALRVTQGTPILFRQERPGLHGEPFIIYKFRTMTELLAGPGEGGDDEGDAARITRLGAHLRALSLDELPELWNVVKGDMSLVGPRPLLMQYLSRYTPEQARRHDVRPGLTGLAQVSGRNATTWEQRLALDVKYVDEHDLRMDVGIIAKTVRIVLAREGIQHSDDESMPEFMGTEAGEPGSGAER